MLNYRQKHILERLSQEEVLTVTQLADELAVSKMTIHRDLDVLQQSGLILKQHSKVFATSKLKGDDASVCHMCNQRIKEQNAFLLITKEGRKIHLCCPHCGLIAFSHRDDIWQTFATDFLHGYIVSAFNASYLIEHQLTICCSPSVLAFASEQEAKGFQKGFGGRVVDMNTAIGVLREGHL